MSKKKEMHLELQIAIPSDCSNEDAIEKIKELSLLLDKYYRSLGGDGLEVVSVKVGGETDE